MRIVIFISVCFFILGVGAQTLDSIRLNKEGAELLAQQNYLAAQEKFLKALAKDPFFAPVHINLGLAFLGAGNGEKAVASYLTALKYADNDQLRFVIFYNLGQLKGAEKKIDEALGFYQQALELNPDSHETKVNIELLIQQGGGQGKSDDNKEQKDKKDKADKGDKKEQKDKSDKDDKKDNDKDQNQQEKPKEYEKNKPQPRKFKSDELNQADVNKILGEIKQQEQKIRQDYNRKDVKERPRGKDW